MRALAPRSRTAASCCLLQVEPRTWTRRSCSADVSDQTTILGTERWRKKSAKPDYLIRSKLDCELVFACVPAFSALHICAVTTSYMAATLCEARSSADPLAGSRAALLAWSSAGRAAPAPWRGQLSLARHGAASGATGDGTAGIAHGFGRGTAPTSGRPRDTHA